MSSDPKSLAEAIRVLKEVQSGPMADLRGVAQRGAKVTDPNTLAFQAQMRMAQQAINATNTNPDEPTAMSFDASLISDSLMMDALGAIAKLTGQELPARQAAAPAQLDKALTRNPDTKGLGSMAALFESGDKGAAAIGYDRTGGTSYGTFQISSRAGTMNRFL
ncbi:MAG: hypothetical protein C0405_06760, partial [Desulfovibrio sp.]|nr:hypothetical protein [Desulfovibrio sp.]